jgi:sugar (pentulose or hexulose) kinase
MVFLRNGTTALNAVVEMFGRALPGTAATDRGAAFAAVIPQLVAAADDCGGLAALPFLDDEPGLGVSRGGTACLFGLDAANATPGNAAKAMLLAVIFNLRIGSELLDAQGFPRTEIILSGGLAKTPELGQVLADAFGTPVVIRDGAAEGTAWGAALLAKYRDESLAGEATDWAAFLDRHAAGAPRRFTPRPAARAASERAFSRHKRLLAIHGPLESALDG